MPSDSKFKILAIDGGGIRGVVPLQIIRYIEQKTDKEIHQCFDLIAGTSTGGILSCALTLQDTEAVVANKRKYSLDELDKIYREHGKEIFPITGNYFSKAFAFCRNWFKPQFTPHSLNKVLTQFLSDSRITNCLKPIYITSYDIHRNKPVFFTYREASLIPECNATLLEICRATSAAPTYFPTYDFNYDSEKITCIDGGIYMNNPAIGALIEVLGNSDYKNYKIDNKSLELSDISILSLGTGYRTSLIDSNKATNWGRLRWIKPVIDLTTNSPVKVVDYQIETIFKSFNLKDNYLRIDIIIDNKHSEMSDSREETIDYLINQTKSQIINNDTWQSRIDSFLIKSGII